MATSKSKVAQAQTRSKTEGKAAKAPAEALREAKQTIEEIRASAPPPPRPSTEEHPASVAAREVGKVREAIGDLVVPMTLAEVCEIIGVDCKPENFAVTAFETLGGQMEVVTELAESTEIGGYDAYRLTENIRQRMLLASRVTAWLESDETLSSLPEVQP